MEASPLAQSESAAIQLLGESGTEVASEASQGVNDIILELDSMLSSLARRGGTGQATGLLEELLSKASGGTPNMTSRIAQSLSKTLLARSPALEGVVLQSVSAFSRRFLFEEAPLATGEGAALVCPSTVGRALAVLPRSFLPVAGVAADFILNPSIPGDATLDTY